MPPHRYLEISRCLGGLREGCQTHDQQVVGCYQVVTTWMGDSLRTGKPSRYSTKHEGQLIFSFFPIVQLGTGLSGWG